MQKIKNVFEVTKVLTALSSILMMLAVGYHFWSIQKGTVAQLQNSIAVNQKAILTFVSELAETKDENVKKIIAKYVK